MRGLERLFVALFVVCSFSLAPNGRFASPWHGVTAESMTLDQATELAIGL